MATPVDETQPLIIHGSDDVFEITDFTVISDTETFIVTLENAIHEWNLGGANASGVKRRESVPFPSNYEHQWEHDSKTVTYPPNRSLLLTHVWPGGLPEVTESANDGPYPVATADLLLHDSYFYPWSVITQQFGVFEYLLLSPVDEEKDVITTQDDLQMIRSAVEVATTNLECALPIFIQFDVPDRIFYVGTVQNGSIRTEFDTIHTFAGFRQHTCLHGILQLLREKLTMNHIPDYEINVAIELEYIIRNDFDYGADDLSADDKTIDEADISSLLIGTKRDVIKEFRLLTGWPGLRPEAISDDTAYTDLHPFSAPRWRASVSFHKGVKGLLATALERANTIARDAESRPVKDIIGDRSGAIDAKPGDAFRKIADPHHVHAINIVESVLPVDEAKLKLWMEQIFKGEPKSVDIDAMGPAFGEVYQACEIKLRNAKASPRDSVVEKLAIALLSVLLHFETEKERITAAAQTWIAFVERLRHHWENNTDIPGLEDTKVPDSSKCLLFQKVQMIQSCIASRRKRHELFDTTKNFVARDDEFYDANEEFMDSEEGSTHTQDETVAEPDGRLRQVGDLTLLHHPDTPLYEPITQDQSPMTEDMLDKHAIYLQSINEDDRIKAQICTLQSDMEAFKAANVGCCIADFVRWHSPRDFVIDEEGVGQLSERMSMEGNIWQRTWDQARAVSVAHQTRLFNESKEAESILQAFSMLKVSEVFNFILPTGMVAAVYKLLESANECHSLIHHELSQVVSHVSKYARHLESDEALSCINTIIKTESVIAEYSALKQKFEIDETDIRDTESPEGIAAADGTTIRNFVLDLMSGTVPKQAFANATPEISTRPVTIIGAPNGPLAMSIRRLLHKDGRVELAEAENDQGIGDKDELKFPPITKKHYTITCQASRDRGPLNMPQRMMVMVNGDEWRCCRSFTSNVNFVSY
uniref:Rab3 GTPase-activating protein catalytic subunit n=1 Tax=Panagrellus redivivus TaxID=6233 RepID=A0A7E4W492_PANRE